MKTKIGTLQFTIDKSTVKATIDGVVNIKNDIATDATVDPKSGLSYYLVESTIENKPLFSYNGEKGELKMGMTCEAQVITKQKKILYYLLEKINLYNKRL